MQELLFPRKDHDIKYPSIPSWCKLVEYSNFWLGLSLFTPIPALRPTPLWGGVRIGGDPPTDDVGWCMGGLAGSTGKIIRRYSQKYFGFLKCTWKEGKILQNMVWAYSPKQRGHIFNVYSGHPKCLAFCIWALVIVYQVFRSSDDGCVQAGTHSIWSLVFVYIKYLV